MQKQSFLLGAFLWQCIFLWCSATQPAAAQSPTDNSKRSWWAGAAIDVVKQSIIDNNVTAVPWSGVLPGYVAALRTEGAMAVHTIEVFYSQGPLPSQNKNIGDIRTRYLTLDYTLLFALFPSRLAGSGWRGMAGATLNALFTNRDFSGLTNITSAYGHAILAGPVIEISFGFSRRPEGLSLVEKINIPLVGYLGQPSINGDKNTDPGGLKSFSSILALKNHLALEHPLSSKQKIALTYTWDYHRIRGSRPVDQANHLIGLTFSHKF